MLLGKWKNNIDKNERRRKNQTYYKWEQIMYFISEYERMANLHFVLQDLLFPLKYFFMTLALLTFSNNKFKVSLLITDCLYMT